MIPLTLPSGPAASYLKRYHDSLFGDVVPWWLRHARDEEQGGYFSCLNRDGTPYAHDKYLWPTARQVWFFSHLYRKQEARPEWMDHARHGFKFLDQHGFLPNGKMVFRTDRLGGPRATCLDLYTKCFAIMAYAEVGAVTNDEAYLRRAEELFEEILPRLGEPSDTPFLGYPMMAKFHLHAHDMVRIMVARVLQDICPDPRWKEQIALSIRSILQRHWHPELDCLLENVGPDGEALLDLPEGRLHHPGHSIESAWFMMEVAVEEGDKALMDQLVAIVLSSFRRGWDAEQGGLRYLINLDDSPTHSIEADCKLLWPQCETLYATLLGWAATGNEELHEAHRLVSDYIFSHYPDPFFGEWFGYLNRDGSPIFTAKANGWEGCFHMPRVLFRCCRLLEKIT